MLRYQNGMSSGENYENFYAKTKDIDDIDEESLIEKLKIAQEEIDNADYKQNMERSLEAMLKFIIFHLG